ncbi:MAG TPA: fibronectin type III domain-containing protein [Candidatus Saccharimonadales bacterium]|nr:fibronectin type III domain-containing protein [Candidatus Saccharimonadales bacterium]
MKAKIPSILGILILAGGLVGSVWGVRKIQNIRSQAATVGPVPQSLRVTNIKDTSFSISWITESETTSFIEYEGPDKVTFQTPISTSSLTHYFSIQNLKPDSVYSFRINMDGNFYDNAGIPWTQKTSTTINPEEGKIVSGKILTAENLPAKNALVYIDAPNMETQSAIVTESGNWVAHLPSLDDATVIDISVQNSLTQTSSAKIALKDANPTPTITIGKTFDFRNQTQSGAMDIPEVQINLPGR